MITFINILKCYDKTEKDDFSISDICGSEEKLWVFPTGVNPTCMTFWLLVQILNHWAMLDLWEQRPLPSHLCHWLKTHISITVKLHSCIMVEPQYNEGPRDFQNLFAIIFHIFYYYWGNENHLLYWGLCYYRGSTVCIYELGEIPGSHPLVTALHGLQYYQIEINRDILNI